MENSIFGKMEFNSGFDVETHLTLFLKKQKILVTAEAFRESDGVTEDQKKSFDRFKKQEREYLTELENLLVAKYGADAKKRFSATQILISRNGDLAILFDDVEDEDEGIAVQLIPNKFIEEQSVYL